MSKQFFESRQVRREKKPHVAFNSGNNEWYTPKEIIEAAREVMGEIDLDPASSELANQIVRAEKFYTINSDGLTKDWHGRIWLNPPYARGMVEKFIDKLIDSEFEQAIVLVNNATDTKWFSRLADSANVIVFPRGRVKFSTPDGSKGSPLQGQAIVYIGDNGVKFREVFEKFGWAAEV